jgi:hypothetical protein
MVLTVAKAQLRLHESPLILLQVLFLVLGVDGCVEVGWWTGRTWFLDAIFRIPPLPLFSSSSFCPLLPDAWIPVFIGGS